MTLLFLFSSIDDELPKDTDYDCIITVPFSFTFPKPSIIAGTSQVLTID